MEYHRFSFKTSIETARDLANDLYENAARDPKITVTKDVVSFAGWYDENFFEDTIQKYLSDIEPCTWLVVTDDKEVDPYYYMIKDGKLFWCNTKPDEEWKEIVFLWQEE